jgi:thymidylate synthase (FAD)
VREEGDLVSARTLPPRAFPIRGGFVELIDVMGSDQSIARAARVSYDRDDADRGPDADARLINFLVRHRHTSPLEMGVLIFHVKLPIFVARQWMRHRTGSFNEVSGRYAESDAEVFGFVPREFCEDPEPGANQQGRGVRLFASNAGDAWVHQVNAERAAVGSYQSLRRLRVSREQARIVLPLATFTRFVFKMDLHNLLHFLKLRTAPGAQAEIRAYAVAIEAIVADLFPLVYAAWVEHVRDAVTLSATAWAAVRTALQTGAPPDLSALPKRERADVAALLAAKPEGTA